MQSNTTSSFAERYVQFVFRRKYFIVALSWALIIAALFVGKDAFNNLRSGGFSPPKAESVVTQTKMTNRLNYPDYTISLLVSSNEGLHYTDALFQTYYRQVQDNLSAKASVRAIIGYYDYLNEKRMVRNDGSGVLLYATIAGTLTEAKLKEIVSITLLEYANFKQPIDCTGRYVTGNFTVHSRYLP